MCSVTATEPSTQDSFVPHRHRAFTSPEQLIEGLALELSNHLSAIAAQALTLQEKAGNARPSEQVARIAQAVGRSARITRTILALTVQGSAKTVNGFEQGHC